MSWIAGLLLTSSMLASSQPDASSGKDGSWTGWITAESCEPKGPSREHRACTARVASEGGRLQLWDVETRRHHPLDDQEEARGRIGYLVRVRGAVKSGAIAVSSIVPAGIGAADTLCTALAAETVAAVTSRSYMTTDSQVDGATLKHCEYRGGADLVSVTLALGSGARERYETSSKFPGVKTVSGIGDLANWEQVRGTLAVLAGSRAVDVRISPSHGSDAERRELASQIAALALGR